MSCIRELALLEPLVDTVSAEAIVSDHCKLWTVDIQTVTKDELAFETPFKIAMRRNDYIHAVVAYFDIEFSHAHKPIRFSTGPHAKYTHWKQTVFYLKDAITAETGETLTVSPIHVCPSGALARDACECPHPPHAHTISSLSLRRPREEQF
jgi:protein arginine N-methyltransferase 1